MSAPYFLKKTGQVDGSAVYRIVSIDNEMSFTNSSPHQSRQNPEVIIRGHSVVHCFNERKPNYDGLKQILNGKTPDSIFENWSRMMSVERLYHLEISTHCKEPHNLLFSIGQDTCISVYQVLVVIYDGLAKGDTLERIFERTNPGLFAVYEDQGTPVTPRNIRGNSLPNIFLAKAAANVSRIDRSRLESSVTPPSACGEFCDYFGSPLPDSTCFYQSYLSQRRGSDIPLPPTCA